VATNIEAKAGLKINLNRMKIEESFRDLKSLLHVDEVLSKTRKNMEKLILLMLIVYTIGVLVGEKVRDRMFPGEKKWSRYSGLFVLLKRVLSVSVRYSAWGGLAADLMARVVPRQPVAGVLGKL
jgi:hypothetical protein